jgi:hypothetical protein
VGGGLLAVDHAEAAFAQPSHEVHQGHLGSVGRPREHRLAEEGLSQRHAIEASGELAVNVPITIESILGTTMSVQVVGVTTFGPHDAIIPQVSGTASIIARNEFYFDPDDNLRGGFIFR